MATAEHPANAKMIAGRRPCLVSFSGVDGSGKTTQIEALLAWLRDAGLRVDVLRFWDDIAVFGRMRETMSHTLFKSKKGIGSPDRPVQRRDKNVRAWYMTAARLYLYFLDAARLAFVIATASRRDADVVIFDRFLYDELANLDLGNPAARAYARLLMRLVPRPDVAFLLDADPVQARARKPEYPLDFIHGNRAAYLTLVKLTEGVTVTEARPAEDVAEIVLREVSTALSRYRSQGLSHEQPLVPHRSDSGLTSR
jgi:thymidylate kinase